MKIKLQTHWMHFLTHGGLLYLILAVVCIVGAGFTLFESTDQNAWNKTRGIVTLSRVEPPMPESHRPTRYLFAYEYQVDRKTYRSDRFSFASVGGDQPAGVGRYKRGDTVTVYYNPQDPSSAVLVKQRPGMLVYVVLVFGLLFFLAAISSLLARNAFALFSRSGWVELWEKLTSRREQAIERLAGADTDDPEALANALQDSLLRECLEYLADTKQTYSSGMDSGRLRLENAARHIHAATEIELEAVRKMMRVLAKRQGIILSADENEPAV